MIRSIAIGFGEGISSNGSLSRLSEGVADTVGQMFQDKAIFKAIFTGNRTFRIDNLSAEALGKINIKTEASGMRDHLITKGIPKEDLLIEVRAKETVGNAYFSKQLIKEMDVERIFVVGPAHHINRLTIISEWVIGPEYKIVPVTSPDDYSGEELRIMMEAEKASLNATFHFWKKYGNGQIRKGDDEKIAEVLFATHIGYEKNPRIDGEDREILEKVDYLRKMIRKYTTEPDRAIKA